LLNALLAAESGKGKRGDKKAIGKKKNRDNGTAIFEMSRNCENLRKKRVGREWQRPPKREFH